MDKREYLERIKYPRPTQANLKCLIDLHQHHLYHIPFENLDIYAGNGISLNLEQVYEKIVLNRRGGFCYELNYLFHWLLTEIGFKSRMISARVINSEGETGPEFDHMALFIETEQNYLVDVGFGDLFLQPLEFIQDKVQHDGRANFKIQRQGEKDYLLSMSADGILFQNEYIFNLEARSITDFMDSCIAKQTLPDSHFVKNRICTKFIEDGRLTLFNDKFVETRKGIKTETQLTDVEEFKKILWFNFKIKG